jgi:hypothetical protein
MSGLVATVGLWNDDKSITPTKQTRGSAFVRLQGDQSQQASTPRTASSVCPLYMK